MASKLMLLLAIIAHTTCTINSMPTTRNVLAVDSSSSGLEMSVAPEAVKISKDHSPPPPIFSPEMQQLLEGQKIEEPAAAVERRSVHQSDDAKLTLDSEKTSVDSLESNDDLETAAGTNILRPLFVYRQQLAYRERIRKARRRAVSNA